MNKFYLVNIDNYQGIFHNSKLITSWHVNDAEWRSEYFNDFLEYLGIVLEVSKDENLKTILLGVNNENEQRILWNVL